MSVAFCKPDRGDIIHERENADGWIWWVVVGAVLPNEQMVIHQSSVFFAILGSKKSGAWTRVNERERCVNDYYFAWTPIILRERH